MDKMKYAINHKWKFSSWSWRLAYCAGFAEVIINALVAIISYFVITFDDTIIDAVKDFLALQVVSDLAKYFFNEYVKEREPCKKLIKEAGEEDSFKLLEIQVTTSRRALADPSLNPYRPCEAIEWSNKMNEA